MVQSVCPVNIKLTDELELSQECFLGNETQMNQVILNICVNAIHAIGHQEGTIKVSGRTAQAGELKQYGLSSVPGTGGSISGWISPTTVAVCPMRF